METAAKTGFSAFCAGRLPKHKIPSDIKLVRALPKKQQRKKSNRTQCLELLKNEMICLLSVACCLSFIVSGQLPVACCVLPVVRCLSYFSPKANGTFSVSSGD
jgi:hypothetical protein